MSERAFTAKTPRPDADSLRAVLGKSDSLWRALLDHVDATHGPIVQEWKHYGSSGWTLKVLRGKRNLFLLIPHHGCFVAAFVFGDRAVAAVQESGLPPAMVDELVGARRYAEGRGLRIPVRTRKDAERLHELVAIKLAH